MLPSRKFQQSIGVIPCHASVSSKSSTDQPWLPRCGPHVQLVPLHFLCQLNGGTGRKKVGLSSVGGLAASVSAVGGAARNASRDRITRNNLSPCGGHEPGSTPASQTGACWKIARIRPSPCLRINSVAIAPDRNIEGPLTIDTPARRVFLDNISFSRYSPTGNVFVSIESKHVGQSDRFAPTTMVCVCCTAPPFPPAAIVSEDGGGSKSTDATVSSCKSPM
mmetsp:Transcript_22689/g.53720  ORF Transcript_22689/g.53720 Transcript_22689/m.53720 type:complete len:221 (-) Transcript_22689:322-984(-)